MPLIIIQQDITKMKVDAIVNAANPGLRMGGGVCGAIFNAAGVWQLQAACEKLAPIQTGEAVITPGFNLPAKFVIHAVGPIYQHWNKKQNEQDLRAAYANALKRAIENDCQTVAFPLISSGIYGYPKEEALQVATSTIQAFLLNHDLHVTLVLFDKAAFSINQKQLESVESYVNEYYLVADEIRKRSLIDGELADLSDTSEEFSRFSAPIFEKQVISPVDAHMSLDDLVSCLDESFSQMLLRLIDSKEMTDVTVYKRANLDRRLFSKIRSNKNYLPSKRTAIALAIGLELSLEETDDFLERAGYALSHAVKFDVIIEYFIINGKYDVFEINEVLFAYDQPLLGG